MIQYIFKKKITEHKLVKKIVKLQKENGLEIKDKMKLTKNYMNL